MGETMRRVLRWLRIALFTVECCHVCGQPKNRTNRPGQERRRDWPYCVNPACVAYREPSASAAYRPGLRWRLALRFRGLRRGLREWLLEDGARIGLGGPPNNWRGTGPLRGRSTIGDSAEYSARFLNDAFEVGISVRYVDDAGDEGRWIATLPTWLFRRLALWYLWRWAYGEWFGLRRRLYYRWLHRSVASMMARREPGAPSYAATQGFVPASDWQSSVDPLVGRR